MQILVTGATDGIGLQTALELARRGARVLVHGRSAEKAESACKTLEKAVGEAFLPVHGDLASLAETRALAAQIPADVDVVVHNAGLYMKSRVVTGDGLETTFQVNALAPFVLTHLLLPNLRTRPAARVVVVASGVHRGASIAFDDLQRERGFDGYGAYAMSKLANVVFAFDLARRLAGTKITSNALHPGVIATKLLRAGFGGGWGADLARGAKTSVKLALDPSLATTTGKYFSDEHEASASPLASDREVQEQLYDACCKLGRVAPIESSPR